MQHGHGDNPAGSFSDSDIDHDFSLSHIVAQTAKIARQPDDVAYDLPESEAEAEENVPPLSSSQHQETPNEKLNQFDVARAKFSQLLESDDDDDSDIGVVKVVNDKHSNNDGGDNDDDDDKTAEMSEDDASSSPASSQKLVQRLRLSGGASLKTTGLDGFSSDEEEVEQEEDSPSPKQQQQQHQQKSNYSTSTAAAEQPGVYKGWRLKQTKEGHLIPNNTQPLVKLDDGTFKKPLGRAPKGGFQWDKYKGIWAVKNSPDEGDGNKELPKPDSTKSSTCRNDGAKGASAAVGTSKRRAAAGAGTKSDPIRCEQKIKYETVAFKDSLLKEGSAVFAPFPDAKSGGKCSFSYSITQCRPSTCWCLFVSHRLCNGLLTKLSQNWLVCVCVLSSNTLSYSYGTTCRLLLGCGGTKMDRSWIEANVQDQIRGWGRIGWNCVPLFPSNGGSNQTTLQKESSTSDSKSSTCLHPKME